MVYSLFYCFFLCFFFFNDTATTEIYTLSLHDALPISWPSPTGPPLRRAPTGPPGSRAWSFHACQGSLTAQSPQRARDGAPCGVAFRHVSRRRHSDRDYFAAQYPACMCPCQRFRRQPCGSPRMTRGQDGSLLLSCVTLS